MVDSRNRPFSVFADESISGHFAVYGQLGTRTELVAATLDALSEAKAAAGVCPSTPLHCKELFHAGTRVATPWAELSDEDAFAVCTNIALRLAQTTRPLISIGFLNIRKMPKRLVVTSPHSEIGSPVIDLPFERQREKQALPFAFSAAITAYEMHAGMSPSDVRIVIAHEESKIEWLQSRRKAHHASADFAQGYEISVERSHPALELADLVAYFGGHLLLSSKKMSQARAILQLLKPCVREFTFTPQGWSQAAINHPKERRFLGKSDNVTTQYFDPRTY
jgi:hypothetical protein